MLTVVLVRPVRGVYPVYVPLEHSSHFTAVAFPSAVCCVTFLWPGAQGHAVDSDDLLRSTACLQLDDDDDDDDDDVGNGKRR